MKKLLVMVLMAVLGSASMASALVVLTNYPAPAPEGQKVGAAKDNVLGPLTVGSTLFSVSTNVKLVATGNAGGYNVASKHKSGDKHFLSSSVSSGIEETDGTKGTDMVSTQIISTNATLNYTGTGL